MDDPKRKTETPEDNDELTEELPQVAHSTIPPKTDRTRTVFAPEPLPRSAPEPSEEADL